MARVMESRPSGDPSLGGPTPPLLLRTCHVATSGCGCIPKVHLQAQAQAQPRALSPEVRCITQGVRPPTGAQLVVIALAHSTNSFLLRFLGGWGAEVDEGDYIYEWTDSDAGQDYGTSGVVCLALTTDLRTLLCVTRDGTAHSFVVKRLLETATRVYNEDIAGNDRWTGHLDPSLLDYTQDPKYARENGQSSPPVQLGRKAVSLGSTSMAGDFVPHCCVWWPTKGSGLTAIIGGSVGQSAALSVVDMEHEREVELMYLPSPRLVSAGSRSKSPKWGEHLSPPSAWQPTSSAPVKRLLLHPDPLTDAASSSSSLAGPRPRLLFVELEDGGLHSLCLETTCCSTPPPPSPTSPFQDTLRPPGLPTGGVLGTPSRLGGAAASDMHSATPPHDARRRAGSAVGSPWRPPGSPALPLPPSTLIDRGGGGGAGSPPVMSLAIPSVDDNSLLLMAEARHPEAGSNSLWERCFLRTVGSPASPLPGAPQQPWVASWPEGGAKSQGTGQGAKRLLLRVVEVEGRLGVLRAKVVRRRKRRGAGSSSSSASLECGCEQQAHDTLSLALELQLRQPSAPSGQDMAPLHRLASPAPQPAYERRLLATLDLSQWQQSSGEGEGVVVDDVASAIADEETLVLCCVAAACSGPSSWVLVYHLPPASSWLSPQQHTTDAASPPSPTLLRAFRCPSPRPLHVLHWLPLSHLTLQDTLNLAQQGFFPSLLPTTETSDPRQLPPTAPHDSSGGSAEEGGLVSTLLLYSRCTLYSLRTFRSSSSHPATAPDGPVLPPELPWPAPGAVLELVEAIARQGRLPEAIHLCRALLQGVPADTASASSSSSWLPPAMVTDIAAADSQLQELWGRAQLAKRCVQWMIEQGEEGALLSFLESNRDYDLHDVVGVLLPAGRLSEALRGSWARGGAQAVMGTIDRLALQLDLPLSHDDMAWLAQRQAPALLSVAQGGLAANLPPDMRLAMIFRDQQLLLQQPSSPQYEWLLTSLPWLPPACLADLVRQLTSWLGIITPRCGGGGWPSQDWHELWTQQGPLAAMQALVQGITAAAPPPPAGRREEAAAWEEQEDGVVAEEQGTESEDGQQQQQGEEEEVEAAGGSVVRVMRLSQLLLFALLVVARPAARTYGLLWCRTIAGSSRGTAAPRCVASLSQAAAQALAAQQLLEQLVQSWLSRHAIKGAAPAWDCTSRRFTPALLLCRALENDNVGCAALLLEAYGRWERALALRLSELRHVAESAVAEGEEARALLVQALVSLLRTHVLGAPGSLVGTAQRMHMLAHVLQAWADMGLPVDHLEALASGGPEAEEVVGGQAALQTLLTLLVELLVLRAGPSDRASSVEEQGVAVQEVAAASSVLPFSKGFLVRLCSQVVEQGLEVQQHEEMGEQRGLVDEQGLRRARREGALWQSLYEQVQQQQGLDDPTQVLVTERELMEAVSAPSSTAMARRTTTGAFARSASLAVPGVTPDEHKLLAFSCGHILTRRELLQRAVPDMETQLRSASGLARPLNLTTELLCKQYQDVSGSSSSTSLDMPPTSLSVACPGCVTGVLLDLANTVTK